MESVVQTLEQEMELLCITGVEDKLQVTSDFRLII